MLRARLAGSRPGDPAEARLAGLRPALSRQLRGLLPPGEPIPAAVLVPLVDHPDGLTVLLTERAPDLRHHPGQISFPGGRREPGEDAVAAALRETEEEIGLPRSAIELLGFLPDHLIISGYRVTPVVGLVQPGLPLRLDPVECAAVFEVPLDFVLDPANHRVRQRTDFGRTFEVFDMPFGQRNIWGATAGMLMTLYWLLTGTDPDA